MARAATPPTLGHLLRQTRQTQGLSLRQAAAQICRSDGTPISPQYLHDLERGRRRPSLTLLPAIAQGLALDEGLLVAAAYPAEVVLRTYLQQRPDCEVALIQLLLTAQTTGFAAWERVTRQIAGLTATAPEQVSPGTPTSRPSLVFSR